MKTWKKVVLIIFVLAGITHIVMLNAIPYVVSGIVKKGFLRNGKLESNILYHGSIRTADQVTVPTDNPDTITSRLVYDIRAKPLRINLKIPENVTYWSFSLFENNLDNFYTLNDIEARSRYHSNTVRLVLVKSKDEYEAKSSEEVIVSPSTSGIGLIRIIVKDRYSAEGQKEIENLIKILKESQCEIVG